MITVASDNFLYLGNGTCCKMASCALLFDGLFSMLFITPRPIQKKR